MINPQLISRISKIASQMGSSATTVKGQCSFIVNNRNKIPFENKKRSDSVNGYLLGEKLDHAKIGDEIQIDSTKGSDYSFWADSFGPTSHKEQTLRFFQMREDNPRKKNINHGCPKILARNAIDREETIHYKGRFKGYTGSNLFADYQSCGAISSSGRTCCIIVGNKFIKRIKAPSGTIFKKDELGIYVLRLSDKIDFHFPAKDLMRADLASWIRRELANKYKQQIAKNRTEKAQKRFENIFKKEIKSTFVSLDDSRRAGNCIEGSLKFAENRLKINREDIIQGRWLFTVKAEKLIKTGDNRAMAAVRSAFARETTVSI